MHVTHLDIAVWSLLSYTTTVSNMIDRVIYEIDSPMCVNVAASARGLQSTWASLRKLLKMKTRTLHWDCKYCSNYLAATNYICSWLVQARLLDHRIISVSSVIVRQHATPAVPKISEEKKSFRNRKKIALKFHMNRQWFHQETGNRFQANPIGVLAACWPKVWQ